MGRHHPTGARAVDAALRHSPAFAGLEWFVAVATALAVGAAGAASPLYNWDLISYVAAAYTADGLSGPSLSERVYRDVAAEVGPDVMSTLSEGTYRATVRRDPEALRQQLPITRVRVAYLALVRLVHRAGAGYPQATYLVSAAAAAAAVGVLALLCRRLAVSLLVVPLVALSCGFVRLARLSTPDALACLVALVIVWLLLARRPAAYAVAALLPLVRTDFVLLSGLVAVQAWLDGLRRGALATAVVAAGLYLGIDAAFGGYDWRTIINVTFIAGAHPYPETMPLAAGLEPYARVYLRGAWTVLRHPHILIYGGALVLAASKTARRSMPPEQWAVLVVMTAFVASHWLLFTVYGERFFSAPASAVLLVGLAHLARAGWPLGGPGPARAPAPRAV